MICYILPSSVARERYRFFESYEYVFAGCFMILVCLMILYIARKNNQKIRNSSILRRGMH